MYVGVGADNLMCRRTRNIMKHEEISVEAALRSLAIYYKTLRTQQGIQLESFADSLEEKQIVSNRTYKRYESPLNKTEPGLVKSLVITKLLNGRPEDLLKIILFPGTYYPEQLATQAVMELNGTQATTTLDEDETYLLEIIAACRNNYDMLLATLAFVRSLRTIHQQQERS